MRSKTGVTKRSAIRGTEGQIRVLHLDGTKNQVRLDALDGLQVRGASRRLVGEHSLNRIEPGTEARVLHSKRDSLSV